MQNGIEGKTTLPTVRKVLDVHTWIAFGRLSGPLEQSLLERDGIIVEDNVRQLCKQTKFKIEKQ